MNGDDVRVVDPRQDGDTEIWGNWTWESPNAVDAIRKLSSVTDVDDTQYYAVPNLREVHRSRMGAVCVASASAMTASGANTVFGSNWTETLNYINANSFGAGGQLQLLDTGWYMHTYSGYVTSSGGNITALTCLVREGAATYIGTGGAAYTFASAAGCTRIPYFFRGPINCAVGGTEYRPAYNLTLSAGTAVVTVARYTIEPIYFVA